MTDQAPERIWHHNPVDPIWAICDGDDTEYVLASTHRAEVERLKEQSAPTTLSLAKDEEIGRLKWTIVGLEIEIEQLKKALETGEGK